MILLIVPGIIRATKRLQPTLKRIPGIKYRACIGATTSRYLVYIGYY